MNDRFLHPVSDAELQRRWTAARAIMARGELDALVMQNSNDYLGGYVRWFTGVPANNAYPRAVVFGREGGMTVVEQGPIGEERRPAAGDEFDRGVDRIRYTASYVSAGFTDVYDARLTADDLNARGARRVGWVAPAAAYFGFGRALEGLCEGTVFVDVTDAIDHAKAVKSAEEWDFIERTIALQDATMEAVRGHIKPGMRDFEVAAFAQYQSQLLGAEQGIFLSSSSPGTTAAVFRPPHARARTIEAGDAFALLVETNGPGGFYGEIGRTFVLGEATRTLKETVASAVAAQAHTLSLLTPGTPCGDVFARHNAYMRGKGLPEEKRLYCHGQGYDLVERPLIRNDEPMTIEQDMLIVVHPGYVIPEANALVCDNYRIGPNGPGDCLHKTTKAVIEVG